MHFEMAVKAKKTLLKINSEIEEAAKEASKEDNKYNQVRQYDYSLFKPGSQIGASQIGTALLSDQIEEQEQLQVEQHFDYEIDYLEANAEASVLRDTVKNRNEQLKL